MNTSGPTPKVIVQPSTGAGGGGARSAAPAAEAAIAKRPASEKRCAYDKITTRILSQSKPREIMRCRLTVRQCNSATVARNNAALGVKLDASFVSFVFPLPLCRACCHTRLSAHAVLDRREPLPAFANLLGLYGRGDRAARALGGRRDGHCPASPLPPLGRIWIRSGAQNLAKPRALVASLDFCRARPRWTGREVDLSRRCRVQKGQRHGAGIRDVEALDRARHVEAHEEIAIFPAEAPQPLAFAAENDRNRAPQGHGCQT